MKIYFGFTVAGDRGSVAMARHIVEWLEARGHEVLTRHLVRDDAREMDRRLTPREVYERDMKWLAECEIFIAEVSGSSFGMGYEAGLVLGASEKRAVLLHRKDATGRISLLITGNGHPRCTVAGYEGFDEVERVLETAVRMG